MHRIPDDAKLWSLLDSLGFKCGVAVERLNFGGFLVAARKWWKGVFSTSSKGVQLIEEVWVSTWTLINKQFFSSGNLGRKLQYSDKSIVSNSSWSIKEVLPFESLSAQDFISGQTSVCEKFHGRYGPAMTHLVCI